ncbi:MAG: hypothetical protein OC190_00260 [Novosphingobium aromaticivorans]|jgi:3-dehydroquinate dehydratase|nr:hypothetical protein [Novosphingobium aromaticivorans]
MTPTPDIHRDLGRLEGRFDAVEDRLAQIAASLEQIDARLTKIEIRENERRGAWVILVALGSILSGLGAWLVEHFWK